MHDDSPGPSSDFDFTRRGFVVTTLAAGFALATQPVAAETITTDTQGAGSGRGENSGRRRRDSRLSRRAERRQELAGGPGRAGNLRRPRAHQGRLPAAGQARLSGDRPGAVRPAGRRFEDHGLRGNHRPIVVRKCPMRR